MNDTNKHCWNCLKYRALYTKGHYKFDRQKFGNCSKHNKIVDSNACCDCWGKSWKTRSNRAAKRVLCDMLANIASIKMILQDEREREKYENVQEL